jgi:Raf kinase inhibitor-like YbhB/YbcL family protein
MKSATFVLRVIAGLIVLLGAAMLLACGGGDDGGSGGTDKTPAASGSGGIDAGGGGNGNIEVTSSAFQDGDAIPEKYTCSGDDVAPPVKWSGVPEDAKALVLVMDDPDADGFVHWLVYDIPVKVTGFEETPDSATLPSGAKQGVNGFGDVGYGGPCPPGGEEHTYRIRILALGSELSLDAGAKADDVNAAIAGADVLDEGKLEGTFAK